MSKYEPLWSYVEDNCKDTLTLSYKDIEKILSFPLDHSFLSYKKELITRGFGVKKISMKEETVIFEILNGANS